MCGEIALCFRCWRNGSFMWLCYAIFGVLAEVPSASERPTCLRFVMDKFGGGCGSSREQRKAKYNLPEGQLTCLIRLASRYKKRLRIRSTGGTDTRVDVPKPKPTRLLVVALRPSEVPVGVERRRIRLRGKKGKEGRGGGRELGRPKRGGKRTFFDLFQIVLEAIEPFSEG